MICYCCGAEISDLSAVCPVCQTPLSDKFNLSISRKDQFFLGDTGTKVTLIGDSTQNNFVLGSGQGLNLLLPGGQYELTASGGLRSKRYNFFLNKNMSIQLSWNRFTGGITIKEI